MHILKLQRLDRLVEHEELLLTLFSELNRVVFENLDFFDLLGDHVKEGLKGVVIVRPPVLLVDAALGLEIVEVKKRTHTNSGSHHNRRIAQLKFWKLKWKFFIHHLLN